MFYDSEKVLEFYQNLPEIDAIRNNYATKTFFKQSLAYFIFLVILTAGKFLGKFLEIFFYNNFNLK
jgi:hypothetical protein